MNALAILAERTADEQRVLAEAHASAATGRTVPTVTFVEPKAPLVLVLSLARYLDSVGRPVAIRFHRVAGIIEGVEVYEVTEAPDLIEPADPADCMAIEGYWSNLRWSRVKRIYRKNGRVLVEIGDIRKPDAPPEVYAYVIRDRTVREGEIETSSDVISFEEVED